MVADHWERQRREIDSYNVFYSAFHGVNGGPTLKDLGFRRPLRFPKINIRGQSKDAEPDIAVYNGSTLLLAEVKSGGNVGERAVKQMQRCASVTIEDAEDYLKDSKMSEYGLDPNGLSTIDPCIVFFEDQFHADIEGDPYDEEDLKSITDDLDCPILTQNRDERLAIERGSFEATELDSFLTTGVPLPKIPPQTVFLNEGIEKESLAVSICFDHVLRDLKNGRIVLTPETVEDIYPMRAVDYRDVQDVLQFLSEVGACRESEDGEYVFEQAHKANIFQVKDIVSEQRVDDFLDDTEDNYSLDEFSN